MRRGVLLRAAVDLPRAAALLSGADRRGLLVVQARHVGPAVFVNAPRGGGGLFLLLLLPRLESVDLVRRDEKPDELLDRRRSRRFVNVRKLGLDDLEDPRLHHVGLDALAQPVLKRLRPQALVQRRDRRARTERVERSQQRRLLLRLCRLRLERRRQRTSRVRVARLVLRRRHVALRRRVVRVVVARIRGSVRFARLFARRSARRRSVARPFGRPETQPGRHLPQDTSTRPKVTGLTGEGGSRPAKTLSI
ncbi:hypothetical protein M885DRAFT_220848 [Pelagophyceae sp. CCMP2097]|nr:hypothetical protein M885DRAFT_220848 [Pelagophyceae sp. CCMP2097]